MTAPAAPEHPLAALIGRARTRQDRPATSRQAAKARRRRLARHRQRGPRARATRSRQVARGDWDARFLGRARPADPIEVVAAKGCTVTGADGKEYLDFFAGWCVGNLGWGVPEIERRLRSFAGPSYVGPHFEYHGWSELAARLARIAPPGLRRSFRATGGTEAVELALQAATVATGRKTFVSVEGCYHGNGLGARSVGDGDRDLLPNLVPGCRKLKPPLDEDALRHAERLLGSGRHAAVILEPVSCMLARMPTAAFMEGLGRLCRETGTKLILDEVACGFGRTGRLFATEHFRVRPDALCLAKGLTGGYAAMGATLMTQRLADQAAEDLGFYSTFGWHPLSVEATLANLDVWDRRGPRILRNVAEREAQLRAGLDGVGKEGVHGAGLALGFDLPKKTAKRLVEDARREGLLMQQSDGIVHLFPPLVVSEAQAWQAVDTIRQLAG